MPRPRRWLLLCFLLPLACGARSGLLSLTEGAAGGDQGIAAGGTRDAGGLALDASRPDQSLRSLCPEPISWKDAHPLVTYSNRHATAPSLAVVDSGDAASARPARVAIQVFASGGSSSVHGAIEVALARVALPWPSGTTLERQPTLWGVESHGWGELTRAPVGSVIALAWHTDQGGKSHPVFRSFDTEAWAPGPLVSLAESGEAVLDLAAGQAVASDGSYAGHGYGVVWRDVQPGGPEPTPGQVETRPLVAVLNGTGAVVQGPFPAAAADGYPGRSPRIVWSGTSYLTATAFSACVSGDPQCSARSVVVARVAVPGDLDKLAGLIPTAKLASLEPTTRPRRAAIATHGGKVFVAWAEGGVDDQALLTVRLARLSSAGVLLAPPTIVAQGARPLSSVSLDATPLGLILSWPEHGDTALPSAKLGRSQIVVHWLDAEGLAVRPSVRLASPLYNTYGAPSAVAIEHPRAVLLTWGGRLEDGLDGAYLAAGFCAP